MTWVVIALMTTTSAFLFGLRDGRRRSTYPGKRYSLGMLDDSPQEGYCPRCKTCVNYRKD